MGRDGPQIATVGGMFSYPLSHFKVFDWQRAVQILKENKIQNAWAGMEEDWEDTFAQILEDGKPVIEGLNSHNLYLVSIHATPVLTTDSLGIIECYRKGDQVSKEWIKESTWPEVALAAFNAF